MTKVLEKKQETLSAEEIRSLQKQAEEKLRALRLEYGATDPEETIALFPFTGTAHLSGLFQMDVSATMNFYDGTYIFHGSGTGGAGNTAGVFTGGFAVDPRTLVGSIIHCTVVAPLGAIYISFSQNGMPIGTGVLVAPPTFTGGGTVTGPLTQA